MSKDNLISVETQTEYSITEGKKSSRIFVKMYVDAVHEGLIADLGAERWQTLCVLASFMNADGECYPSQDRIAGALKIRRESANRRIKSLCDFRWNGRPLVVKEQVRKTSSQQWDNTRYTILPLSQLAIFDSEPEKLND